MHHFDHCIVFLILTDIKQGGSSLQNNRESLRSSLQQCHNINSTIHQTDESQRNKLQNKENSRMHRHEHHFQCTLPHAGHCSTNKRAVKLLKYGISADRPQHSQYNSLNLLTASHQQQQQQYHVGITLSTAATPTSIPSYNFTSHYLSRSFSPLFSVILTS